MKSIPMAFLSPNNRIKNNKQTWGILFVLLMLNFQTFAQDNKPTLEVDKRFHDFGQIKEDGGKVNAVFTIKNTGTTDLLILNAEPSCGCTLGEWTKEPIAPGKTGTVTAIFDPKNMIGIIDKTIGVYTNAKFAKILVLELRGEVVPRDRTMEDIFPYRVGNLMFDRDMIQLDEVLHNMKDSGFAVMYNDGQYPIKINSITPLPNGYRVRAEKYTIEPGQEVRLYASVDGSKFSFLGPFNKTFKLLTDDPEYTEKPLSVLGNVKYNFGKPSRKELKAAPKFNINSKLHDFGSQPTGAIVSTTFTISNSGKSDLFILSLNGQCYCTEPSIDKSTIKPGESATLTIKFDLIGGGNIQKPVTIYTNDPKNPTVDVVVKAQLY